MFYITSACDNVLKHGKASAFSTMEDEKDNELFYGVELEVANAALSKKNGFTSYNRDGMDLNQIDKDLSEYCIFKPDCSFEITTVPATLRFHKERLWNAFFKNSAKYCTGGDGVGLHIHFTKAALSEKQLAGFVKFINLMPNNSFLSDIAGRPIHFSGDVRKGYGSRISPYIWANDPDKETVDKAEQYGRFAVHVSKRNAGKTVELRIFQSIPTEQGLFQALEFTDALIMYFAEHTNTAYKEFLNWCKLEEQQKTYPYLRRNLATLGYLPKIVKTTISLSKNFRVIPCIGKIDNGIVVKKSRKRKAA